MFSQGVYEIEIISGGSGVDGTLYMQWFKMGRMVYISFVSWNFRILNPTRDLAIFTLPFVNFSERAIGVMGFNDSGINMIPVSVVGNSTFSFAAKNQDGSTSDLTGMDIPTCIIQFNLIYFTSD